MSGQGGTEGRRGRGAEAARLDAGIAACLKELGYGE
jgi:hypothetical protein